MWVGYPLTMTTQDDTQEGRETMLDIQSTRTTTALDSSPLSREKIPLPVSPTETRPPWHERLWHTVKRYPLPCGSVALLLVSLVFWLAGRGDLANWALLAVVLLGGFQLCWETVKKSFKTKFALVVMATLPFTGWLLLGNTWQAPLVV